MNIPIEFESFRYPPLPTPTSIRIVRILKGSQKHRCDSPRIANVVLLQCSLETIDLKDEPKYKSLSYTWGASRLRSVMIDHGPCEYSMLNPSPIAINGRLLFVTKNLHDFLLRIAGEPKIHLQQHQPFMKTDLHDAAERGDTELVDLLISRGIDLGIEDIFGETALHYAAENGHVGAVQSLIAAGADVDARDKRGRTPWVCAVERCRGDWRRVMGLLMEAAKDSSRLSRIAQDRTNQAAQGQMSEAFWIDAICIDQRNIAERSAQVAMMPDIYRQATAVVSWLGAMDAEHVSSLTHRLTTNEIQEAFISQLVHLLLNSYFFRLWVIQELSLARTIDVMYGDARFSWNLFLRLLAPYIDILPPMLRDLKKMLDQKNGSSYEMPDAFLMSRLRLFIAADSVERRVLAIDSHKTGSNISLPLLLAMTWDLRCTDPKDNIYSLLSIAKTPVGPPSIKIDYGESVELIYLKAAHHFIRGSGDDVFECGIGTDWEKTGLEPLEALSFIQHTPTISQPTGALDLPSWVPDFSAAFLTRRIFDSRFSAAKSLPLLLELDAEHETPGSVLRLSVQELDKIEHVEARSLETTEDMEPDVQAWLDIALRMPLSYPTGKDTQLDVFLHCVSAGRSEDAQQLKCVCTVLDLSSENLPKHDRLVRIAPALKRVVRGIKQPDENMPTQGYLEDVQPSWTEELPSFVGGALSFYTARRLFVTAAGLTGLGPSAMLEGDVVCLVAGARTPFVMRRLSKPEEKDIRYAFVGEAYVHGIMCGEAVTGGARFEVVQIH